MRTANLVLRKHKDSLCFRTNLQCKKRVFKLICVEQMYRKAFFLFPDWGLIDDHDHHIWYTASKKKWQSFIFNFWLGLCGPSPISSDFSYTINTWKKMCWWYMYVYIHTSVCSCDDIHMFLTSSLFYSEEGMGSGELGQMNFVKIKAGP